MDGFGEGYSSSRRRRHMAAVRDLALPTAKIRDSLRVSSLSVPASYRTVYAISSRRVRWLTVEPWVSVSLATGKPLGSRLRPVAPLEIASEFFSSKFPPANGGKEKAKYQYCKIADRFCGADGLRSRPPPPQLQGKFLRRGMVVQGGWRNGWPRVDVSDSKGRELGAGGKGD